MKLNYDKIYEDKNQAFLTATIVTIMVSITSYGLFGGITFTDLGLFALVWGVYYFAIRLMQNGDLK